MRMRWESFGNKGKIKVRGKKKQVIVRNEIKGDERRNKI